MVCPAWVSEGTCSVLQGWGAGWYQPALGSSWVGAGREQGCIHLGLWPVSLLMPSLGVMGCGDAEGQGSLLRLRLSCLNLSSALPVFSSACLFLPSALPVLLHLFPSSDLLASVERCEAQCGAHHFSPHRSPRGNPFSAVPQGAFPRKLSQGGHLSGDMVFTVSWAQGPG